LFGLSVVALFATHSHRASIDDGGSLTKRIFRVIVFGEIVLLFFRILLIYSGVQQQGSDSPVQSQSSPDWTVANSSKKIHQTIQQGSELFHIFFHMSVQPTPNFVNESVVFHLSGR